MSENQNESSADRERVQSLLAAVIILAILLSVPSWLREEMNAFAGAVSYLHVHPFGLLAERVPVSKSLPLFGPGFFAKAELAKLFLEQGNFAHMSPEQRREVLSVAGLCAMPIYLPFMIAAAVAGRNFRPDIIYRNAYSLDRMIRVQSEHWLTSRTARHVNPLEIPEVSAGLLARRLVERARGSGGDRDRAGELVRVVPEAASPDAWHRALLPEEWLVAKGLCIDRADIDAAIGGDRDYPDGPLESPGEWSGLTLDTLMEVLLEQLRSPWKGFASMRPAHKALCAAMCLFHDYDIVGGNLLLNDLGAISDATRGEPGGMDGAIRSEEGFLDRVDAVLGGKPGQRMLGVANGHAWLESAFPAMLAVAREDRGVLPAAAFLWLKGEDRPLWYILDNVGSEAVMIEAAGAISHFRAERQIGKPIRRPAVYQAARALLEDYLDMTPERVARRGEQERRARTAGRRIDILAGKGAGADSP